jgi:hypothetical protein
MEARRLSSLRRIRSLGLLSNVKEYINDLVALHIKLWLHLSTSRELTNAPDKSDFEVGGVPQEIYPLTFLAICITLTELDVLWTEKSAKMTQPWCSYSKAERDPNSPQTTTAQR